MSTIYKNQYGTDVYDFNGQTIDAHTGSVYQAPSATPTASVAPTFVGAPQQSNTYGAVNQNPYSAPTPPPVTQTGTATLANGQVVNAYSDGSYKSNGTALTGSLLQEAQTKVGAQNSAPTQNVYDANPYWLRPGESVATYNSRIAGSNNNLPAPGTTSSTGIINNQPLSSASLAPGASYNFQTPPDSSFNTTGALTSAASTAAQMAAQQAAYAETSQQKKESDISTLLQSLNTQEAGKPAAQAAANESAGVNTAQATVNDLSAKLSTLTNEAAAIKMTPQQGQGVTTAVDNRQRDGALRENAISALAVSSLLNAANGALATAQAQANKTVALIFDPIEAQIKANIANLQLIRDDPATKLQEQQQAQAQLDIKTAQTAAIAQQKENMTAVLNFANNAAASYATDPSKFTPTAQYPNASVALTAMQQAHSVADAAMIAASTGLGGGSKTGTWGTPYLLGGNYVQKNSLTGEIRTASNPDKATTDTFGKPTASDVSAVMTALAGDSTASNSVDKARLQTDTDYFYWVKSQLGI